MYMLHHLKKHPLMKYVESAADISVTFIFFEKTDKIKFKYVCLGVVPMLLYGIYYVINIFSHIVDGKVIPEYDWYGFAVGGVYTVFITFPIMLIVTYLISLALWKFNKI